LGHRKAEGEQKAAKVLAVGRRQPVRGSLRHPTEVRGSIGPGLETCQEKSEPGAGAAPAPSQLAALRQFAVTLSALTIVGHAFLGFEQSYAQPLVALGTAYGLQILLESLAAWGSHRPPRFAGGILPLVDFLLAAHITALAIAALLYFNDRLWVVAFATAVAIGSKTIFRVPVGAGMRHFLNPSNFGITVTLLTFPWVGLAMPWQFTAAVTGAGDWGIVGLIVLLGSSLNGFFTKRMPLIATWVGGFVLQAVLRSFLFQNSLAASLAPMTGFAFVMITFYMLPDPATTPERPGRQIAFGAALAAVYGLFMAVHVVFGLIFALTIVCAARGSWLYALAMASGRRPILEGDPVSAS
jgi:hypothetical protein